jgi:ATP-dependent DNA helicase DinG
VAILDERLSSKNYGRRARQDLPAARYSRDFRDVHRFFQVEDEHRAEFALNVWASQNTTDAGQVSWRWQLVRLHDGRADSASGVQRASDPLTGEVHAIHQGLADLRRRIEQAGQTTTRFSVEIRCSAAVAARLADAAGDAMASALWRDEQARWKALALAPVRR